MVCFVNKPELSDQKNQTNGILIEENCNGELLFPMKEFVSFGTDRKSMYFMSTRFLKENIYGFHVHNFKLLTFAAQFTLQIMFLLSSVMKYIICGSGNQKLELQECENCIKS